MSGVEVRPLSRLPRWAADAPRPGLSPALLAPGIRACVAPVLGLASRVARPRPHRRSRADSPRRALEPCAPTHSSRRTAAPARRLPVYFPGDADHHHPRSQEHRSSLEIEVPAERLTRAVGEAVRAPVAPHAGPRLPARQGAARPSSSAVLGPRRGPRRGGRPPRPDGLPRRPRSSRTILPLDQRRRRDRPGRGGQAAHLQGDRPGPAGGHARRLPELQLPARDRDDRRRQGRQGHRGAARPERDARAGRGPRRAERRLRGHRLRRAPATA